MMPHSQKSQPPKEACNLVDVLVPMDVEEGESTPCTSNLIQVTPRQMPAGSISSYYQCPWRASPLHNVRTAIRACSSDEVSRGNQDADALLQYTLSSKAFELVRFLLLKFQMRKSATKAEMLDRIIRNYQDYSTQIFMEALQSLWLIFGLELKEVDAESQSYVLVPALELTYHGMLSDNLGMPKTGFLIIVLGLIFIQDNHVDEEEMWKKLNYLEVYAERYHLIYGYPRKLITEDFVQQGYLEYRQVPHSNPARYEFLWGPRAYAETSKMKVLEFFANILGRDPRSYPVWYIEALRDEKKRAPARLAPADDGTAKHGASSSTQTNFQGR